MGNTAQLPLIGYQFAQPIARATTCGLCLSPHFRVIGAGWNGRAPVFRGYGRRGMPIANPHPSAGVKWGKSTPGGDGTEVFSCPTEHSFLCGRPAGFF